MEILIDSKFGYRVHCFYELLVSSLGCMLVESLFWSWRLSEVTVPCMAFTKNGHIKYDKCCFQYLRTLEPHLPAHTQGRRQKRRRLNSSLQSSQRMWQSWSLNLDLGWFSLNLLTPLGSNYEPSIVLLKLNDPKSLAKQGPVASVPQMEELRLHRGCLKSF